MEGRQGGQALNVFFNCNPYCFCLFNKGGLLKVSFEDYLLV